MPSAQAAQAEERELQATMQCAMHQENLQLSGVARLCFRLGSVPVSRCTASMYYYCTSQVIDGHVLSALGYRYSLPFPASIAKEYWTEWAWKLFPAELDFASGSLQSSMIVRSAQRHEADDRRDCCVDVVDRLLSSVMLNGAVRGAILKPSLHCSI